MVSDRARALFDNGDRRIVPGQFVRVRIEGIAEPDAVAVPRRAVMSSAQGNFVWVVGADPGDGPQVLHWDGSAWETIQTGYTGDMWWVQPTADGADNLMARGPRPPSPSRGRVGGDPDGAGWTAGSDRIEPGAVPSRRSPIRPTALCA